MDENEIEPITLPLEITLPRCSTNDLGFLIHWSGIKADDHPHFAKWVCLVATCEVERRMHPGSEAGMVRLPALTAAEYSDFLLGSHVLSNWALTETLARFADDLALKIICSVTAVLETYVDEGIRA